MKLESTYEEVLTTKIETLKKLTALRKEQDKCYYCSTFTDSDGSKYIHIIYKNDRLERLFKYLETEISKIPDLWSLYGSVCTSKSGELIQIYQIQLNNNLRDLSKKLRNELRQVKKNNQ